MNIPIDQAWIEAVMLAGVRIVAFIVIAPPFSHNAFPLQIKGMLAIGLALAVSPVAAHGYEQRDFGTFLMALFMQLLIGAALGFLVFLVFAAIQSAGQLVDNFGGFQMSAAFDPQGMLNGAQFTRLFQMTSLALLFSSDGYQMVIGGLTRSFTAIPLGSGLNLAGDAQTIVTAVTQMFLASVQVAGPLIVVLFLADAGLGLLTRVAPALNAFQLGFPLKIFMTLSLGGLVFTALPRVVTSLTDEAVRAVVGVR